MSTARKLQPMTLDDYRAGERIAMTEHEVGNGVVYAMAGATNAHNLIATNAIGSLHAQLRGKRCRVFNSDTKLRVQYGRTTRFYYADASVICEPNSLAESFQEAPVVVIDVVSESTRRVDELEKRDAYLTIDSLRVYILLEQGSANANVYRRGGDTGFEHEHYEGLEAVIPLPEIECDLRLSDLYQDVTFPPPVSDDEYQ